jgi:hypothetical protein
MVRVLEEGDDLFRELAERAGGGAVPARAPGLRE